MEGINVKKSINKIILILIAIIIGSSSSSVFATDLKTALNIVQKSSEKKYLENDQGYISKSIVDIDSNKGEVTIELKLSNTKKAVEEKNYTEVVLLMDNSHSMKYKTNEGKTRKSIIVESAKELVNTIYDTSKNVKTGIVKFCGEMSLSSPLNAATIITNLTTDKQSVLDGLETYEKQSTQSSTNIQKGLIIAENMFSKDSGNKIIILLTDGVPTEDGYKNAIKNDDMSMTNETYNTILENTKKELLKINDEGIRLISVMTGINSNDLDENGNVVTNTEDDLRAVEKIFGTQEKPTTGKFYNAKTSDADKIIKNDIAKDVQEIINTPITNLKIIDYFPDDIMNNFDFSYVNNPSLGEVSKEIQSETKTIEWNIKELKGSEVATLRYKLKLKDMKNTELLNKTISTNEKVVFTYQDIEAKEHEVILESSPKIKLAEAKKTENANDSKKDEDKTTAPGKIPQTGVNITIALSIIVVIAVSIVIYKKYRDLKDI